MEHPNGPQPQHPLVATRDRLQRRIDQLQHDLAEARGAFDLLAEASAKEIGGLRQQVEGLLEKIEAVELGGLQRGHPLSARSQLFDAARQVRKELREG